MNILKALYYIYGIVCIAIFIWFFASYIDAVINPLRQSWNLFDLILSQS